MVTAGIHPPLPPFMWTVYGVCKIRTKHNLPEVCRILHRGAMTVYSAQPADQGNGKVRGG